MSHMGSLGDMASSRGASRIWGCPEKSAVDPGTTLQRQVEFDCRRWGGTRPAPIGAFGDRGRWARDVCVVFDTGRWVEPIQLSTKVV